MRPGPDDTDIDWTPAATILVNLADGSTSWAPELSYMGVTNLELRLKASLLTGKAGEESLKAIRGHGTRA